MLIDEDPKMFFLQSQREKKMVLLSNQYDTICAIIETASKACSKYLQILLGVISATLTILVTGLITYYSSTSGNACTNCRFYEVRSVIMVYFGIVMLVTLLFACADGRTYKRQMVYRKVKIRIQNDLWRIDEFDFDSVAYQKEIENDVAAARGLFPECKDVCGIAKELFPYILVFFGYMVLMILFWFFFK